MRTEKAKSSDVELDDGDLVHRYFGHRAEVAGDEDLDSGIDEQVENDWFVMGDQESWIDSRPGVSRSWETPRKP